MTSTRFDPFAQTTGSLVNQSMNTPLEPDDPRLQVTKRKPTDVEMPREITITGNNVPASSRRCLNRQLDPETARTITRGRVLRNPTADASDATDTEALYQAELAKLRRKYWIAPDGAPEN
jgi:hypothetical protein